jgi:hypothetical protein
MEDSKVTGYSTSTTGNKSLFRNRFKIRMGEHVISTFIDINLYTNSSYYDALSEEGRKYTTKDCWYKCNVSGGENM